MNCTLDCANQPGTRHWHLDACAMRGRSIVPPDLTPGQVHSIDQIRAREADLRERAEASIAHYGIGHLHLEELIDDLIDVVNSLAAEQAALRQQYT